MPNTFDDFLTPDSRCEPPDTLKNAIFHQTTRLIRRRKWTRRLALLGAAAACYLLGMATTWLLPPRSPAQPDSSALAVAQIQSKTNAPAAQDQPAPSAALYEWQAITEPSNSAAEFKKAGDLYMQEEHDYAAALRCYTQALNAGGDAALEPLPEDNWLIKAIKNARKMEKFNER